ncbi:hypothetical protein HYC85_006873 [Camellia sinensis]|uniref:F-box domain-containing protein n=1 Tax=Camellia sinensis TaxID=4442 RepID=A0A7J7HNK2_CAMSI|nr:hypothetical protein HYC85_006873 [Camellia sinensis]
MHFRFPSTTRECKLKGLVWSIDEKSLKSDQIVAFLGLFDFVCLQKWMVYSEDTSNWISIITQLVDLAAWFLVVWLVMEYLPVEVIGNILSRLGAARDVVIASTTCRKWREAWRNHLHTLSFNSNDWSVYN